MARLLLAPWLLLAGVAAAEAHPAPFSFIDLRVSEAGLDGSVVVHDLDVGHELGIEPASALLTLEGADAVRDRLAALLASRLELAVDGRRPEINWGVIEPLRERQSLRLVFSVRAPRPVTLHLRTLLFPYDSVHQTFVNIYEDGELRQQAILAQRRQAVTYYAGSVQGRLAVLNAYLLSGIEHILIGPDHLLFLVGLLLPGGSLWRLAGIVTAFTAGHTATLTLATLQIVTLPATLVEPAIALSIIVVGVDNLLVLNLAQPTQKGRLSLDGMPVRRAEASGHPNAQSPREGNPAASADNRRDVRAWVAAGFGLVHGFGFASVLTDIGLPDSAIGWSLLSFNLGVELGQLAAVVVVASALAAVHRKSAAAGRFVAQAGSAAVVLAGSFWFVERTF